MLGSGIYLLYVDHLFDNNRRMLTILLEQHFTSMLVRQLLLFSVLVLDTDLVV